MDEKLLHILLVDDDEVDVMNVQRAFKKNNIINPLYVANNGLEALALLRGQGTAAIPGPRRLILLDLNMPRKDGREALREIKADPDLRRIPVVVLTTSQADTDIGGIYELGANSFICKPVKYDSLVKVMRVLGEYWFRTVEVPGPKRTGL